MASTTKFQTNPNCISPFYVFESTKQNQSGVLDILVHTNKQQKISDFFQNIKQSLEKDNKNFKLLPHFEKRGQDKSQESDVISIFVAYDQKQYSEAHLLASQIIEQLNNKENLKQNSQIISQIDLESLRNIKESEILQQCENPHIITNSSFDGQSSDDTEGDSEQVKQLQTENNELKSQLISMQKKIADLERGKQVEMQEKEYIHKQYIDNLHIIMEQKSVMDSFQQEFNQIKQERDILLNQRNQQLHDIKALQNQVYQLNQTQGAEILAREESITKQLEEKTHQLNKFVTWFLIQENKGKCFSNDKKKQRTWEIQEMLKEHHIKKELQDILQLK